MFMFGLSPTGLNQEMSELVDITMAPLSYQGLVYCLTLSNMA